jgi:phosphodiesterase/alkaline phosphatase D-like protein
MSRASKLFLTVIFVTLAVASVSAQTTKPTLTVVSGSGLPTQYVDLPVRLDYVSTPCVGSMQFDVVYPTALTYTSTALGQAASDAQKSVSSNVVSPGTLRVLLFSISSTGMASGEVVKVRFTIPGTTNPGQLPIQLKGIVLSDLGETSIDTGWNDGILTVIDAVAPQITGLGTTSIGNTGATITWTTNEAADSQVEYGVSTNPYPLKTSNASQVTSHTIVLTGLNPSTTYHYRATSKDASGNSTPSSDMTFTTTAPADTTPPVISNISATGITVSAATIQWSTNENATSVVKFGLSSTYGLEASSSSLTLNHAITLTSLASGKTYHYQVVSADNGGNKATSADYTFTTLDMTPPVITGPAVTGVTKTGAVVSWTTDEAADTLVQYGTTASYGASSGSSTPSTSHTVTLTGLTSSTLYHYKVTSADPSKNSACSVDLTFTTADGTPPVISGVSSSAISATSATVTWTTDEASSTVVRYGTTSGYGSTVTNPALVTVHSATLTNLTASTTYHFQVSSTDSGSNSANSGEFTFATTSAPDKTPPVISSIAAINLSDVAATITWSTDEGADSSVVYGTTTGYGSGPVSNPALVTAHSVALSGLTANTTYHYKVTSQDSSSNSQPSGDYTFTTKAAADKTPPVISATQATSVTSAGATITWVTDESSDSTVAYGTSSVYDKSTKSGGMSTSHSVVLTGLSPSTTYHFAAKSADASGNIGASGDLTFTTAVKDTNPPVISGLSAVKISSKGAVIIWQTDKPADTLVEYGPTSNLGKLTKLNKVKVTGHSAAISGLKANTKYYYRAKSRDNAGNQAVSDITSFTTNATNTNVRNLFYPRLVSKDGNPHGLVDSSEYTGFAVVNMGTSEEVLTFTAYDKEGNEITGEDIANPSAITLAPGTQLPVVDVELFGAGLVNEGRIGWIKLESTGVDVAGFTLMFNSSLTVLDGAPAFVTPYVSSMLTEIEDEGSTQIHIANPNEDQVPVLLDLVRQDGSVRASATRMVNGNGVIAEYLNELFPDTPAEGSDYIRILSGKGVIPFQMLGKPAQYLEGLNGQDMSAGATTLYSPQYAVGGPWRSTLSVVNLDSNPGTVTFRLIGDDGAQIGPTRVLHVAPNGKVFLKDQFFFVNSAGGVVQGYVQINSDVKVAGSVVFGDPERKAFAAALPLTASLQASAVFSQIASNDTYFTGLAILNPSDTEAAVTLEVFAADGTLQATTTETLRPRQRVSKLLTQFFPQLVGENRSSGYVRMTSDTAVASFALFGTHDLSVLSAVPAQPAP